MTLARALCLAVLLTLATAAPAGAEDPDPTDPTDPTRPTPAATSPTLHGRLSLSLAEATKMGLENNLDVEVERHAPLIAQEDERIAFGAYDPEAFADFGYADIEDPNANVLLGTTLSTTATWDGFSGLRGLVPYLGSSYDFQFDGSRRTTNSSVQVLSPELRSSFNLGLTQPMLRNLIWNREWTSVKTTRVIHESSLENFRRQVMDTVQRIEDAYWLLIANDEQVDVARKSLETARALLSQTQIQYEVGVVSKVEVVQAEAGVAQREFDLIVGVNRYRNQQDVLINLVLGAHLAADSTLEIEPTDRAEDFIPYQIDVEDAVAKAFALRPELAEARREIERNELELRFAKNQRLPQLDAVLSYGNRGLAGNQNPNFDPCRFVFDDPSTPIDEHAACLASPPSVSSTDFPHTVDGYSDAQQYTARAMFSLPLPNTAARHTVSRRELELRRATVQRRRLEQSIIVEVRRSARDLEASQEGIGAAERARVAAAEQLRAEEIRLEYGESTPFDVLLREEDLVEAESKKIDALRAYRVSATGLDRAQGTILRNRNIRIDQVTPLR